MAPLFSSRNFGLLTAGSRSSIIMNNAPEQLGGPGPVDVTNRAPFTFTTSSSFTASANFSVRIKVRGATRSGLGGYATATVPFKQNESYNAVCDPRYAALFYGLDGSTRPVCIMLGAEGGYAGNATGGNAGHPAGSSGTPRNNSGGGGGGTTTGYLTGSGGGGGGRGGDPRLPASPGSPGGAFSAGSGGGGSDGSGGPGGFGYYGGGGGGGGWDYGSDYGGTFGGGGGGGSNYVGGLPPAAPYPIPISSTLSGAESGGVQIEIISINFE